MTRSHLPLFFLIGLLALLLWGNSAKPPAPPLAPPVPVPVPKPAPEPPKPKPRPGPWGPKPCPKCCGQEGAGSAPGKPVIGGKISPDGAISITCDLPESERKRNIASKGLGCCVFRSGEYAARWKQLEEFYDLPEKMVKAGIEGGGYPEKVDKVFHKFGPNIEYVQDTTGDAEILEAILKTNRIACVTYDGHDPHYGANSSIAHMVCLVCFDSATNWACVSDNNFIGDNDYVWMSRQEFLKRWKGGGGGGWVYCLLAPPPPPVPHN